MRSLDTFLIGFGVAFTFALIAAAIVVAVCGTFDRKSYHTDQSYHQSKHSCKPYRGADIVPAAPLCCPCCHCRRPALCD